MNKSEEETKIKESSDKNAKKVFYTIKLTTKEGTQYNIDAIFYKFFYDG